MGRPEERLIDVYCGVEYDFFDFFRRQTMLSDVFDITVCGFFPDEINIWHRMLYPIGC